METVLLVAHLLIAVALISVILIQRTAQDGGGIAGGGGTMGGLFTARGSANLLTRTTAILATSFICTSLALGIMATQGKAATTSLVDQIAATDTKVPTEKKTEAPAEKNEAPKVPVSK